MIALVMGMVILAGALPILGLILWVGWGKRRLGVSLIGAGLFLAFLITVIPMLDIMRRMSAMAPAAFVTGCFKVDG